MLFSDKKRPAILRIVERRGGCDVFTEESKFRLDKLPPAHRAALAVELGPAFGLHGDAARHGCAAFGVGGFLACWATRSFARAAVGGFFVHIWLGGEAVFARAMDHGGANFISEFLHRVESANMASWVVFKLIPCWQV